MKLPTAQMVEINDNNRALVVMHALLSVISSILLAQYLLLGLSLIFFILYEKTLICILGITFLTILGHYLYVRLRFDRELLFHIMNNPSDSLSRTQHMDIALTQFGFLPKGKAERPWSLRLKGIKRLLLWQIACLVLQFLFFMGVMVVYAS